MTATHDPARRSLLLGRPRGVTPLRPPWALAESDFVDACTACGACVQRCPEQVLVRAAGGYPVFDPRLGECTFCGDCAAACEAHALDRTVAEAEPWPYRAIVGTDCLTRHGVVCASCRDVCPERAIQFKPALPVASPQVDNARCTGCGACVGACPVTAIALRPDITETA